MITAEPDLTIDQVCGQNRLCKSVSWLKGRLAEDRRRPPGEQRFQHHHYVGRSPRWTEQEYQALRAAIVAADTARYGAAADPSSRSGMATGTLLGRSESRNAQSALERVLAFRPQPPTAMTLR